MMYSKTAELAIHIMTFLARVPPGSLVKLDHISTTTDIQRHNVVRITQQLQRWHLVRTSRGPTGGVQLAKDPKNIALCQIVCAIDGAPEGCPMEFLETGVCTDGQDCPLHRRWNDIAVQLRILQECVDLQSLVDKGVHLHMVLEKE